MWTSNPSFHYKPVGKDTRKPNEKKAYTVMTSHPLYIELRKKYGLELKKRKIAEESVSSNDEEEEYEDGDEYVKHQCSLQYLFVSRSRNRYSL